MSENFNEKEIDILNALYELRLPSTTNRVAEKTDYTWKTVNKYLKQLQQRGYVLEVGENESAKWRLRTTEDEPQKEKQS